MAIPIYTQMTLGRVRNAARAGPFSFVVAEHLPGTVLAAHGHESMHICFIVEGGFVEGNRGRQVDCCAGTLIIKAPGYEHWNRIGQDGARTLAICTDADAVWRDLAPGGTEFQVARFPSAGELATQLHREMTCATQACPIELEGLALELVSTLARPFHNPLRRGVPIWLSRAREILHDDSCDFGGLQDLAARVGVHPVHLARAFRQRFGCTMGDYLRSERVTQAKHLLSQSGQTIAQIAAQVGFSDQAHLTRVFRRVTGTTPGAYRRHYWAKKA